jgi:hypothetical protein
MEIRPAAVRFGHDLAHVASRIDRRPDMTTERHAVVVGYDGSESSRAAIVHAVGMRDHTQVVIVPRA